MEEETRRALWSVTETEAACMELLAALERAREALRKTLEGGGNST